MKRTGFIIIISIGFLSGTIPPYKEETSYGPVVELFTSEGCSSCPAADDLLKEMSVIREKEGKPFIALSFHVTYWNRQGWIDSFSNEAYTERQKNYQRVLNIPQSYTPQAIVNGIMEFVGSNPFDFRKALEAVQDKASPYTIKTSAQQKGDTISIEYELNKEPGNEWLNVAIVEKFSERKITRGENRSRTLKHFNVVRKFKTTDLKKQDVIGLSKMEDLSMDDMEIVLYIQHKKSMKILAASKLHTPIK